MKTFLRRLVSAKIICGILISCSNEKIDCSTFKTGTFKYLKASAPDTKIYRNDSIHIESSVEYSFIDTYKVFWTDECSYFMVIDNTTNDSLMPFKKTDTLYNIITEVTDSSYKYISTFHGMDSEGEVIRPSDSPH